MKKKKKFQSTHSLRSATSGSLAGGIRQRFQSTHSLRSATSGSLAGGIRQRFQSTHSLRSATVTSCCCSAGGAVSIHALLAECDLRTKGNYYVITKVSIHALLAECDLYSSPSRTSFSVSIHALLAECDRTTTNLDWLFTGFNPRTPCGVRP